MYSDVNMLVLMLLVGVFIFALIVWYYKKYIVFYCQFPNISVIRFAIKYALIAKKDIPVTSYFLQTAIELCQKFRSEGLFICWIPRPSLVIFDDEAMKIFSSEHSLINKVVEFEMFKEVFGAGLLTSNDDKWRKRKKLLNPIFHITMVKDKVSIVSKNAALLVEKLRDQTSEPHIDILKYLQFCSFRNISEFLIGPELHNSQEFAELERIMASISKATSMLVYRILHPWFTPRFTLWFFSEGRNYIKMLENAHEVTKKVLHEKKDLYISSKTKEKDESKKRSPSSFTEILIEHHLKDPSFSFDDMLDEINTFVSAGFDAVSYGMMWCLYLLGHHPEVQEQIYEEVESTLRSDLTHEELSNFRYMDCVIKEALRLYPPIPLYARQLVKPVTCGKYTVPEGTTILFFPFMTHRNPKMFPDPEKFDPDRFLDHNPDKKLSTYSFAEGQRNCLGRKFAEIEMKITLAHLIKNFKIISLDRREDIRLKWEGFLKTVKPLHVRLVLRQ